MKCDKCGAEIKVYPRRAFTLEQQKTALFKKMGLGVITIRGENYYLCAECTQELEDFYGKRR